MAHVSMSALLCIHDMQYACYSNVDMHGSNMDGSHVRLMPHACTTLNPTMKS